ncbi:MAG: hypothetical protein JXX14_18595, partial [Deltaproteobacteria bacterium]|nr:hypothetical protein [Deltaproteobacteria bacterium]
SIRPGDVLLCNPTEKPVLHRVARKSFGDAPHLVLKSDVGHQMHHVAATQVVGRLVAVKQSRLRLLKWSARAMLKSAALALLPQLVNRRPRRLPL